MTSEQEVGVKGRNRTSFTSYPITEGTGLTLCLQEKRGC